MFNLAFGKILKLFLKIMHVIGPIFIVVNSQILSKKSSYLVTLVSIYYFHSGPFIEANLSLSFWRRESLFKHPAHSIWTRLGFDLISILHSLHFWCRRRRSRHRSRRRQCDHAGRIIAAWAKKNIWAFLEGLFTIWQNILPTLAKF